MGNLFITVTFCVIIIFAILVYCFKFMIYSINVVYWIYFFNWISYFSNWQTYVHFICKNHQIPDIKVCAKDECLVSIILNIDGRKRIKNVYTIVMLKVKKHYIRYICWYTNAQDLSMSEYVLEKTKYNITWTIFW